MIQLKELGGDNCIILLLGLNYLSVLATECLYFIITFLSYKVNGKMLKREEWDIIPDIANE